MNENKVKVWLARDKGGALWLYQSIPNRDDDEWLWKESCCKMDSSNFPSVKWEDEEPTEAYITLSNESTNKQSIEDTNKQSKEIDWEQRRYEIARDLLMSICSNAEILHYNELAYAQEAIELTDILIKELKKEKHNTIDTEEDKIC